MHRSIRAGAAFLGVAGAITLAGCGAITAGADEDETATTTDTSNTEAAEPSAEEATSGDATTDESAYIDGTYSAEGSYNTPSGSSEEISVTITLEDDAVTAVDVSGNPQASESQRYQSEFIDGVADQVVGQPIDDLNVSQVGGSSLTSGGFNQALEIIKAEAIG